MKTKKSLYQKRSLTYEEHKKIDEFLRYFQKEGQEVFDLLRQGFEDGEEPVRRMAIAANLMSGIHGYCETKSWRDRPRPLELGGEEYKKWYLLYYNVGLWITDGWEKLKRKRKVYVFK